MRNPLHVKSIKTSLKFLSKVIRVMFFQYSELICSLRNTMKAQFLSVVHAKKKFISRGHLIQ